MYNNSPEDLANDSSNKCYTRTNIQFTWSNIFRTAS